MATPHSRKEWGVDCQAINDLDDGELVFIVGSWVAKSPVALKSRFRWHGDAFSYGPVIDTLTSKYGKNNDWTRPARPA